MMPWIDVCMIALPINYLEDIGCCCTRPICCINPACSCNSMLNEGAFECGDPLREAKLIIPNKKTKCFLWKHDLFQQSIRIDNTSFSPSKCDRIPFPTWTEQGN